MGSKLSILTQRSPAFTLVLLFVVGKNLGYLANKNPANSRYRLLAGAGQTKFNLLSWLSGLVQGDSWTKTVVGDVLGLVVLTKLVQLSRWLQYDASRLTLNSIWMSFMANVIDMAKMLPMVRKRLKKEADKIAEDVEKDLKPKDGPSKSELVALPKKGMDGQELLQLMESMTITENTKWEEGLVSGAVYHGEAEHLAVLNQAYTIFSVSNSLHPDIWPSVMKFESEIIAMTADMLNGGDTNVCGYISSGGTESIVLSVKTHRQWGYREKGITQPELVFPVTAHAAFDKACDILGVKPVKLPVDPVTFKVDPKAVRAAINSNTIMIVGSAPNFPQGTIDDIPALSALAVRYNVGLHVDCCLGGFVLPFARKLGYDIPEFDFALPGVTAMSCDTHKYGYANKGTSVVLYRSKELRHHQYFTCSDWTGGLYVTPGIRGSTPGALSAACWASMIKMGEEGYMNAVDRIMKVSKQIIHGIETRKSLDGIHIMGEPKAMVVAFGTDKGSGLSIYNICDAMAKRGWSLNALQRPACAHICVTYRHAATDISERFLNELGECVQLCRGSGESKDAKEDPEGGSAPIYGMASSLPAGPVNELLCTYVDVTLSV
jgi:glutamate/tyrosine decarboxylase-like PLP-dependent enzyme